MTVPLSKPALMLAAVLLFLTSPMGPDAAEDPSVAPPSAVPNSNGAGPPGVEAVGASDDAGGWYFQILGPGMWPLWLCSVLLVALVLERRRALAPERIVDPSMVDRVADLASARNLEEAQQIAGQSDTVLGRAWAQGIHEYLLGGTTLAETLTNSTLVGFKPLKKNLLPMATIGVISPLLGLLGTVVGMIVTFHQIAATGGADKARLAGGIGLALFTTAGGLIVAIPAIIGNRYFQSRLTGLAEQAEEAISRVSYRYLHAMAAVPREAINEATD